MNVATLQSGIDVCLWLTQAMGRGRRAQDIYDVALEALARGLGVDRSSILLFDPDGVMRFKASRGISDAYRAAVEGHTPWSPSDAAAEPLVVGDVEADPGLAPFLATLRREGIGAMTFIPLVSQSRVVGKFMLYYAAPYAPTTDELKLAGIIAAQVAFAVERLRERERTERGEERLRIALEAARMGTWEWDCRTGQVRWSENLEGLHGLSPGSFGGTFDDYARAIHPEDRDRVLASIQRAVEQGVLHDVEYRMVTPEGAVHWVEGKGRVIADADGRPLRMTGVCVNVTDRKEADLQRLAAVQEASRLKDEFLAVLSHELRTPLNAIVGWLYLVQTGTVTGDRVAEALTVIGRNARQQAQLIDQMLDVSRIITGRLAIERVPLLLGRLIENAVNAVKPAAIDKTIALTTSVAPSLPSVDGDPERLQQVLGNLLSNAVKFTPPGGRVWLTCAASAHRIIIEVRDTGRGIPAEFQPFIFERFRQADSTTTRPHGGLGLGLSIARHLIELHGGTIEVESEGVGRGSTFRVTLPAAARTGAATARSNKARAQVAPALHGTRVLVVDDEPDSRELLAVLFSAQGSVVRPASSADEALSALEADAFDLLVADIAMPRTDGYALIRHVRRARHNLRAIAVTAYARPEDRVRTLEAGYDAFFAKPFDTTALLKTAAELAEQRALANGRHAARK
jgi:PAS domain S-box-containing protein